MPKHLEVIDAFMEEFDAAMEAVCLLPGSISDSDLDPRLIAGAWSRRKIAKQRALIDYARQNVRADIKQKAKSFEGEQEQASSVDLSAQLYLDAKSTGATHGGEYFWIKLMDEGGLQDKGKVAYDQEYLARPKSLRSLPVAAHEDYVYYRATITAFAKTVTECLNQRIQEIDGVKNLTPEDSDDALKVGDDLVKIRSRQRLLELGQ